jgi:hypothetical protein
VLATATAVVNSFCGPQAGCAEVELRAISGHRNLAEIKPYIEKVEQRRATASAMAKMTAANNLGISVVARGGRAEKF